MAQNYNHTEVKNDKSLFCCVKNHHKISKFIKANYFSKA